MNIVAKELAQALAPWDALLAEEPEVQPKPKLIAFPARAQRAINLPFGAK